MHLGNEAAHPPPPRQVAGRQAGREHERGLPFPASTQLLLELLGQAQGL